MKIEGSLKKNDDALIKRLESMPFEEARDKILKRQLGNTLDSPNHQLCLSWLQCKESKLRDDREEETLSIARKALRSSKSATWIATSAIILSIIMAIGQIIQWYSN
ncbi:MAG: hypothetical protein KAR13_10580 [Desulfobulbaceae bacterium]|nr:hypothetical protein [Desulfobulbaceae bacterium]